MDEDELERAIEEVISREGEDVDCVYLYGSRATGRATARSDVDVAVLLRDDPPPGLDGLRLDLEAALETRLGREVDLLVLNRAAPDLVHRVLRDGRLLIERDPSHRIRFEVKSRNEYFDLKPVLDEYRRPRGRA